MFVRLTAVLLLALFAAPAVAQVEAAAPASVACPAELPEGAACWRGRAPSGGLYWTAYPRDWNGVLVVHAHGGPRLGEPRPDDPVEDLQRFSMMVRAGYAWTGSTYRRGGYGVRVAAADADELRRMTWARFGRPRVTILHGQSYGGNVAAKAAELHALELDGSRNYDGVLLTSGVLAGGTRAYQFRAGLRAVYQHYCRNHPGPDEAAYPLWSGLPADARMTRDQLAERVRACTGVGAPEAQRTAEQRRRLTDILGVTGVREDQLVAHLAWGTFLFRDLVGSRLGGRNPFTNTAVVYQGSSDDAALNRDVLRFEADPRAVAELAYDSDLSGLIVLPTLTLHGRDDPTAMLWQEEAYASTVAGAGRSHLLLQVTTDEDEHSRLEPPQYVAALDALVAWIGSGRRPSVTEVVAACEAARPRVGGRCRIVPSAP